MLLCRSPPHHIPLMPLLVVVVVVVGTIQEGTKHHIVGRGIPKVTAAGHFREEPL